MNEPIAPERLRFDPGEDRAVRHAARLLLPSVNPWPFGFLTLLALSNTLHWRLRSSSRWGYAPGRHAVGVFASLAVGAAVGLLLSHAGENGVMGAICLYSTLVFAYTAWRRERRG